MEFNKKFRKSGYQKILENIAYKYRWLVKKWILNRPVNDLYLENRKMNKKYIERGDLEYYALIDWTLPSISYDYSEVSLESVIKMKSSENIIYRSSFIPVTIINGEYYWLLGSFHDYPDNILSDFGGKYEKYDKNIIECASRELNEESLGVLSSYVSDAIKNPKNLAIFKGTNEKTKTELYFTFVYIAYKNIKDVPKNFEIKQKRKIEEDKHEKKSSEKFGNMNFYKQSDIHNFNYMLSKNLTDLILFFNK